MIAFNERDTCMVVLSNDGFLYRYDLISFTKRGYETIDRNCDFRSCIFLNDPSDEYKVLTCGADV